MDELKELFNEVTSRLKTNKPLPEGLNLVINRKKGFIILTELETRTAVVIKYQLDLLQDQEPDKEAVKALLLKFKESE
jgi:hypothetical protein